MYRQWKQVQVAWNECRNVIWTGRDGIRKVKAEMKMNQARVVDNNKKGCFKQVG